MLIKATIAKYVLCSLASLSVILWRILEHGFSIGSQEMISGNWKKRRGKLSDSIHGIDRLDERLTRQMLMTINDLLFSTIVS